MVSTIVNRLRFRLLFLPTEVMNVTARKQLAAKQKSMNAVDSKNIGKPVPATAKTKGGSKPAKKAQPRDIPRAYVWKSEAGSRLRIATQVSFSSLGDSRADLY